MKKNPLLNLLLAAALALGLAPLPARAADAADAAQASARTSAKPSSPEDIDALLAAGPYEEGEAIATVAPDVAFVPETPTGELAEVICAHLFDTEGDVFEQASGTYLPEAALEGAQDGDETVGSQDVQISTYLLSSNSLTTRELLEYLAEDPRVVSCSPNYLYSMGDGEDAGDGADAAESADAEAAIEGQEDLDGSEALLASGAAASDADAAANAAATPATSFSPAAPADATASLDATPLQWAYNRSTPCYKGILDPLSIVGDAAWHTGAANSSGLVAVVDTGIDYTHPDLAASMADLSAYAAAAGGTSHGYNAFDPAAEPADDHGHGTHVAGILAAADNGFGISGAANGAKLVAVKVGNASGRFPSSEIASGYAYLKRLVQAGADLRVANNSWSGPYRDPALDLAVAELGSLGVVSVFASGNNAANIDGKAYTAASLENNPYSVVVDSLDADGKASRFSNRGKKCTDVFAPGGGILSTTRAGALPTYLPAAMRGSSQTYVGFSSQADVDAVGARDARGNSIGSLDEAVSYDGEGGSLAITGKQLVDARPADDFDVASKRVILSVPVDESALDQASMLGLAARFRGRASTKAWLEVMADDGNWMGSEDEKSSLDSNNWAAVSLDLHALCSSHGKKIQVFRDAQGKAYIQVSICLSAKGLSAGSASLYVDAVGVGSAAARYGYMSGTSMAAPAVSGLAAVLTDMIPAYASIDVEVRAAKASNILVSSARKSAALEKLCSSGGVVDPTAFAAAIAADKTPYIGNITVKDSADGKSTELTLTGAGFGASLGDLALKDVGDGEDEGFEVVSWSDSRIVIRIAAAQGASQLEASVTNAAGEESDAQLTSVYGSADEPEDPDDPAKPVDPAAPSDPATPSDPGADPSSDKPKRDSAAGGTPATGDASVPSAALVVVAAVGAGALICAFVVRRKRP